MVVHTGRFNPLRPEGRGHMPRERGLLFYRLINFSPCHVHIFWRYRSGSRWFINWLALMSKPFFFYTISSGLTCSSCACPNPPLHWGIWGCCKGAGRSHSKTGRVYHRAGWSGSGSPCSPRRWQCNTLNKEEWDGEIERIYCCLQ